MINRFIFAFFCCLQILLVGCIRGDNNVSALVQSLNGDEILVDSISVSNNKLNRQIVVGFFHGKKNGYETEIHDKAKVIRTSFWRKGIKVGQEKHFSLDGSMDVFCFYDPKGRLRYRAFLDAQGVISKEEGELSDYVIINSTSGHDKKWGDTLDVELYYPLFKEYKNTRVKYWVYSSSAEDTIYNKTPFNIQERIIVRLPIQGDGNDIWTLVCRVIKKEEVIDESIIEFNISEEK